MSRNGPRNPGLFLFISIKFYITLFIIYKYCLHLFVHYCSMKFQGFSRLNFIFFQIKLYCPSYFALSYLPKLVYASFSSYFAILKNCCKNTCYFVVRLSVVIFFSKFVLKKFILCLSFENMYGPYSSIFENIMQISFQ